MNERFLTLDEVLQLHELLIEETGGGSGLRELPPLEAAVLRPAMGYYEDIFEEAAALMESLAVNHPFVDGNKRIAFAAADVFLRLHGWQIESDNVAAHAHFIKLFETGTFRFEPLATWLRAHAVELKE